MMHKPKFIDAVQRIHARVMRVAKIDPAATAAPDGSFPVDNFEPGLCEMNEEDWRQFRMTPENALTMVNGVNAAIAAGKQVRGNYAHDRSGPICADVIRAEVTPGGGVRSFVKWSARAQAAIRPDANGVREYEGTSPEFFARVVLDEDGDPLEENGRVLMEPFGLTGFALDNDPAMPDLAIAANTQPERPEEAKEEIMDMKKLALAHGLPETASLDDIEKAAKAKDEELTTLKAAAQKSALAAHATTPVIDKETVATIAAQVLAQINPKELAKQIREASRADAEASIRAETLEKDCGAAVDAAIMGGRVKKSERASALKLAKVDLDAFKTMTAGMKLVAPVSPLYRAGDASEEGTTAVTAVRHRFDVIGANASASDSPDVRDFKEFVRWTAAFEATAGNTKFKSAADARAAFNAARLNQERTA